MSVSRIGGFRIAGITTCVPPNIADNADCAERYGAVEVRKVVAMAGIKERPARQRSGTANQPVRCQMGAHRSLR